MELTTTASLSAGFYYELYSALAQRNGDALYVFDLRIEFSETLDWR